MYEQLSVTAGTLISPSQLHELADVYSVILPPQVNFGLVASVTVIVCVQDSDNLPSDTVQVSTVAPTLNESAETFPSCNEIEALSSRVTVSTRFSFETQLSE